MLPVSVKPEAMERVLAIATEPVEGREGYPVGCLFTLGNSDYFGIYGHHFNHFMDKDEDRIFSIPSWMRRLRSLRSMAVHY